MKTQSSEKTYEDIKHWKKILRQNFFKDIRNITFPKKAQLWKKIDLNWFKLINRNENQI